MGQGKDFPRRIRTRVHGTEKDEGARENLGEGRIFRNLEPPGNSANTFAEHVRRGARPTVTLESSRGSFLARVRGRRAEFSITQCVCTNEARASVFGVYIYLAPRDACMRARARAFTRRSTSKLPFDWTLKAGEAAFFFFLVFSVFDCQFEDCARWGGALAENFIPRSADGLS